MIERLWSLTNELKKWKPEFEYNQTVYTYSVPHHDVLECKIVNYFYCLNKDREQYKDYVLSWNKNNSRTEFTVAANKIFTSARQARSDYKDSIKNGIRKY